jgi:hypothetical protein
MTGRRNPFAADSASIQAAISAVPAVERRGAT